MAEKNIAAFLRDNAKTIGVRFLVDNQSSEHNPLDIDSGFITDNLSKKEYTYVTELDLAVNDLVVVRALGNLKVAIVSRIDEVLSIEPNSTVKFSWVVSRVNSEAYEASMAINAEIESTVSAAYKKNLKQSFKTMVMGSLDQASQDKIAALLR